MLHQFQVGMPGHLDARDLGLDPDESAARSVLDALLHRTAHLQQAEDLALLHVQCGMVGFTG